MYERNRYGRKTELTRKALLRYIIDRHLQAGDRLPSQAELVQLTGTSSSTVIRAVNSLHDDGILEVRDKVGVFLRNDKLAGKVARTIALLTQCTLVDVSPHYAGLTLVLINQLQQAGCQTLIFTRESGKSSRLRSHRDFPGLNDALRDGKIDAVFDFTGWSGDEYFSGFDVPLITMGPTLVSANNLIIDMAGFCREAVEVMAADGAANLRIISPHKVVTGLLLSLMDEFAEKFPGLTDGHLLTVENVCGGRELAREFFQLPAPERPDCFIFMDEFIGADFLNGLAVCRAEKAGYHPRVVLARDPDLQTGFPRDDIFFFEKRIHDIADLAVNSLLAVSRNQARNLVSTYHFTRIGRRPFFVGPR